MRASQVAPPEPVAITVDDEGNPRAVEGRAVIDKKEAWELDTDWWTPTPLHRRYFELVDEDGRRIAVFFDVIAGHWRKQRGV
jgi:hypothetical protein